MMFGLAQDPITTAGNLVLQTSMSPWASLTPPDCTSFWNYLIYPVCANAPNNWLTSTVQNKFYGLPEPPVPPPVGTPPIDPTTGNVTDPCAADPSACVQEVTAAQVTEWQAANQAFFDSLPATSSTGPGITGPLLLMIGAAAVLFFGIKGVSR